MATEGGNEGAVAAAPTPAPKKDAMQYDDKFYDLDDAWICDDEIGREEDGVDFVNESES